MSPSSQSQPPAPVRSFWQNSVARLLGIPLSYWVLGVFCVVFFACYVVPVFLNDYHELRVYPDFPAINPIGGDLREYLGFSKALLENGSPYIPPNYYPPLQALLFAPLVRFGPDQSYVYITALNFLSFLAITWLYPWLASRPRQWNQLATLGLASGLFSYGLLFQLERGQFDLLVMTLCYAAIYLFHHHPRLRLLAYLLFVVSVNIKIYPLVFILCFTLDWRDWKRNLLRWGLLGLANLAGLFVFAVLAVAVVCLRWNFLTASELLTSTTIDTFNASEQIKLILQDPGRFFTAIGQTILTQTPRYARNWVGASGYDYWPLPEPVFWITPLLILLAILSDSMGGLLNLRKRLIAVASFLVVFLSTIVMFYLLYNPPGTTLIPGVQGRYFLFITPLLFLACLPNRAVLRPKSGWLTGGSTAFVALLTVGGLFLAYHFTCGSAWYTTGLCTLPRHKNQTAASSQPVPLPAAQPVTQTFAAQCNRLTQTSVWFGSTITAQMRVG